MEAMYHSFGLMLDTIVHWYEGFIKALPNILLAILVFYIGFILAKSSRRATHKVVTRIVDNKEVTKILEGAILHRGTLLCSI